MLTDDEIVNAGLRGKCKGHISGIPVYVSPLLDVPKLRFNLPSTPIVDEMNAWLVQRFGYKNSQAVVLKDRYGKSSAIFVSTSTLQLIIDSLPYKVKETSLKTDSMSEAKV